MKVKLKSNSKIVEAKRFKDMSEEDKEASIGTVGRFRFEDYDIFIPCHNYEESNEMLYLHKIEYEVVEESNKLATTEINIDYYNKIKGKADNWDEKEMPYKIKTDGIGFFGEYGRCTCGERVFEDEINYCPSCGQKIYFSESED